MQTRRSRNMHATISKIPLPLRSIEYHFFTSDTPTAVCVESNSENSATYSSSSTVEIFCPRKMTRKNSRLHAFNSKRKQRRCNRRYRSIPKISLLSNPCPSSCNDKQAMNGLRNEYILTSKHIKDLVEDTEYFI